MWRHCLTVVRCWQEFKSGELVAACHDLPQLRPIVVTSRIGGIEAHNYSHRHGLEGPWVP